MYWIAGEWFITHGRTVCLDYFCKEENHKTAEKLKIAVTEWINNGQNDFEEENTIILETVK